MIITIELELSSPYVLSPEEIEKDLKESEDQIGWCYDYIIKSVKVNGERTMSFKDKKKLEEEYYKWIEENHVADCPFSVITFLQIKGLLKDN